jgi:hypothetical protein
MEGNDPCKLSNSTLISVHESERYRATFFGLFLISFRKLRVRRFPA